MSFAGRAKKELAGRLDAPRHCRLAELAAVIGCCGRYEVGRRGKLALFIESENPLVAGKAEALMRRLFRFVPEVCVSGTSGRAARLYTVTVLQEEAVREVLGAVKILQENGALVDLSLPVSSLLVKNACCRRAFVRGMFLCAGTFSDPSKSYHFEVSCENAEKAEMLREILEGFDLPARIQHRKNSYVVYLKDGDSISVLLNLMGAPVSQMALENVRILRDISGSVNRQVNCETANLKKTVKAALEQVRQIETIRDSVGLAALPPELRTVAQLRLENPDMGLVDLGALLDPPLGKSGLHHRFAKIKAISEEIRNGEGNKA